MKRIPLSPVTSLLVSLSLVVGILVSDIAGLRAVPKASAQTNDASSPAILVQAGTLAGGAIAAKGVVVNGVVTDGVFADSVGIGDAVIDARCGLSAYGYNQAGEVVYALGVLVSGNLTDEGDSPAINGILVSGDLATEGDTKPTGDAVVSGGVYVGQGLQVSGGTVTGDVQVNNGVISGSNLTVVGGYVSGGCPQ